MMPRPRDLAIFVRRTTRNNNNNRTDYFTLYACAWGNNIHICISVFSPSKIETMTGWCGMGYDYNKALDYPHSYYKDICTEGLSSRHALCLKRNRNGSV